MTLLKRQNEMYLESSLAHTPSTACIVLDWLRRIIFEASETFIKIYQEIRSFVVARRRKDEISKRRKKLAQLLGSTYKAILECQTDSMIEYPVCAIKSQSSTYS